MMYNRYQDQQQQRFRLGVNRRVGSLGKVERRNIHGVTMLFESLLLVHTMSAVQSTRE